MNACKCLFNKRVEKDVDDDEIKCLGMEGQYR